MEDNDENIYLEEEYEILPTEFDVPPRDPHTRQSIAAGNWYPDHGMPAEPIFATVTGSNNKRKTLGGS